MTIASTNATRQDALSGKARFLTVWVFVGGAILLATNNYFVSELLVIWAALAALFVVGTGVVLFIVLVQEGVHWGVRKIIQAKQRTLLPRGAPSFRS